LKIGSLKPLGKSGIDRVDRIVRIPNATLRVVEAPETHGGSQFEGQSALTIRHRPTEMALRWRIARFVYELTEDGRFLRV